MGRAFTRTSRSRRGDGSTSPSTHGCRRRQAMVEEFLGLPMRPAKPRERGLTHVMDKGLTLVEAEGLLETAGEYVDIVKLGWGTSYVTANLAEKIRLYQSHAVPVMCGGTLLEAAIARGRVEEFKRWTSGYGFTHV